MKHALLIVFLALATLLPAQQFNQDIIPASPGLNLGHTNQRWNGYFQNIDIAGNCYLNGVLVSPCFGGGSSGSGGTPAPLLNCSSGTTLNEGVQFSTEVVGGVTTLCGTTATANSISVIGICTAGCGNTGSATVAYSGYANGILDNLGTQGDYVVPSATPGQFTDIGTSKPAGTVELFGIVASNNTAPGSPASIFISPLSLYAPGSSGGSGTVNNSACAGAIAYFPATGNIVGPDCSATSDGSGNLTVNSLTTSGSGTGVVTFTGGSAPSNPASGKCSLYFDLSSGSIKGVNSSGGSCGPATTSLAFSAITTGANTQANMQVGSGAQISPVNSGQVASTATWLSYGLSSPTVTGGATSSGTLQNTHYSVIQFAYNIGSGTTTPSQFTQIANSAGGCASNCSVTVTAPTLPSGITGYTVFYCDLSSGTYPSASCTSPAAPQRVTACINITTNCVITAVASTDGTALPTTNTAWTQPPNVQAGTIPSGAIPSVFFPKADGNNYPWITMNWTDCSNTTGPPLPCGTPLFTHRTFFNDIGGSSVQYPTQTQGFKNAFISINHGFGNGTVTGNQDRALGILAQTPANDSGTHWGLEALQTELDFNCNGCSVNGTPDGEIAAGSFQVSDSATTVYTAGTLGPSVIRAEYFKQQAGNYVTGLYNVFNSIFMVNNKTFTAGTLGTIYNAQCANGVGGTISNFACVGLKYFPITDANKPSNGQWGFYWQNSGSFTPTFGTDWFLRNDQANLASEFGGSLVAPSTIANSGTYTFGGSMNLTGGFKTSQMATPVATASCATAGSTTFTFTVVAVDVNGNSVPSATITTLANCASDITATNKVRISITGPVSSGGFGNVIGTDHFDFYFTSAGGGTCNGGACTLGKVASCTPGFAANVVYGKCPSNSIGNSGIDYTGTAGDGTTAPTINTTGGVSSAVYLQSKAQTFVNLPTCASATEGATQAVTDSTTTAVGTTITGSGTNHVNAYCNGTNWIVQGGTTYRESLISGGAGTGETLSATNFVKLVGGSGVTSTEASVRQMIPFTGTITNLCVTTTSTQSNTGSLVFTLRDSTAASNTSLVVTIAANAAAGTFCDNSDAPAVTAQHDYVYQVQNNATVTSATVEGISAVYNHN